MKNTYCSSIKKFIIDKLKNHYFPKRIYLFGSTAKNLCTEKSDVDILVKFKSLDVNDINNSALYKDNIKITEDIKKDINKLLGINPITKKHFDIQIVGAYELRFFQKDYIDEIFDIKIKLGDNKITDNFFTKW